MNIYKVEAEHDYVYFYNRNVAFARLFNFVINPERVNIIIFIFEYLIVPTPVINYDINNKIVRKGYTVPAPNNNHFYIYR